MSDEIFGAAAPAAALLQQCASAHGRGPARLYIGGRSVTPLSTPQPAPHPQSTAAPAVAPAAVGVPIEPLHASSLRRDLSQLRTPSAGPPWQPQPPAPGAAAVSPPPAPAPAPAQARRAEEQRSAAAAAAQPPPAPDCAAEHPPRPAEPSTRRCSVDRPPPPPTTVPSRRERSPVPAGSEVMRWLVLVATVAAHTLFLLLLGVLSTHTALVFTAASLVWEIAVRCSARAHSDPGNPFLTRTPRDHHWLRWCWPAPLLLPLRLCLFFFCLAAGTVAARCGTRGVPVIRALCRVLLTVFGFNYIPVWGERVDRSRAPVLIANHRGPFEGVYLLATHNCGMLAADRRRFTGVLGPMKALGFVFVDRDQADSRRAVLDAIRDRALARSGPQIMLFPEGTTSNGSVVLDFKYGAFVPGVPVQPVCFRHPYEAVDVDASFSFGVEKPLPGLAGTMLRLMISWYNPMEAVYLPPVLPTEAPAPGGAAQFAQLTRTRMADALGVPATEHTQEDVRLMAEAQRCCLPPGAGTVEFGKLKRLWQLSMSDAKELLGRFADISGGKETLNRERFATMLGLPPDGPIVSGVFDMLCAGENSGGVSFRDFLASAVQRADGASLRERQELIFDAFDINGDGIIQREELETMLSLGFSDLPQTQVDELWGVLLRSPTAAESRSGGVVTKEHFLAFLAGSGRHQVLFDALSGEARAAGSPRSRMPRLRQESFLRRRRRLAEATSQAPIIS